MDTHAFLIAGAIGLSHLFVDRKKYGWRKVRQFFAIFAIAAFGAVQGIDPVWLTDDSLLKFALLQAADHSGLWTDSNGFLIQVGTNWYGIYHAEEGLLQIPILVWPTIVAFLGLIVFWLLDWRQNELAASPEH